MALEMEESARRRAATPEQTEMDERADELREWLDHLESWVESQMASTRAFLVMLNDHRQAGRADRQKKIS